MKNRLFINRKFIRIFLLLFLGIGAGGPLSFAQKSIYHIGDVIQFRDGSTGVVCYVNPDNPQEGWVMDIVDVPADTHNLTARGKFALYDGAQLPFAAQLEQSQNCYDVAAWTPEGKANTKLLNDHWELSPLIREHYVADHYHNGWYIPDIQQLTQMFFLSVILKDSVEAYGGNVFLSSSSSVPEVEYWSSSAISNNKVQTLYFSSGQLPPIGDCPATSTKHFVRLVRDFKVDEAVAYWLEAPDVTSNSLTVTAPSANQHFMEMRDSVFHAMIVYGDSLFEALPTTVHMHPVYRYQTGDPREILIDSICAQTDKYTRNGFNINVSNPTAPTFKTYQLNLHTRELCDSIVKLKLRVDPKYEFHDTVAICETGLPFEWEGRTYYGTTVDSIHYKTEYGCHCDSVRWLHLYVAQKPNITINQEGSSCQNENFTLTASTEYAYNAFPDYEELFDGVTSNNGAELENDAGTKPIHLISSMTLFKDANYAKWLLNDRAILVGSSGIDANTGLRRYARITTKPLDLSEPFVLNLSLKGWGRTPTSPKLETPPTRVVVTVTAADGTVQRDSLTVPGYNSDVTGGTYQNYQIRFEGAGENAAITLQAIDETQYNPATDSLFEYADQRFYMQRFAINNVECDYKWFNLAETELATGPVVSFTTSHDTTLVVQATTLQGHVAPFAECVARDTVTVKVINPTVSLSASGNDVCEGSDLELNAVVSVTGVSQELLDGAQVTYQWTDSDGPVSTQQNPTISAASIDGPDEYVYTVSVEVNLSDGLCVVEREETVSVEVYPSPETPKLSIANNTSCEVDKNGTITLQNSPAGYSYALYQGDNLYIDFQSGTSFTGLAPGSYTVVVRNEDGCTSSIPATIMDGSNAVSNAVTATACDYYVWNNVTYTESDDYQQTFTNVLGCDSIVTLHLTINKSTHDVTVENACEEFSWHNELYDESGTYTYIYTNVDNCPSVDTLKLTIKHGTHTPYTVEECDSYPWHGQTYTQSDVYTYDYTNGEGCPSTDTLKLTIKKSTEGIDTQVECDSYKWIDGITYTTSTTTPTHVIPGGNSVSCDSTVTLHLTIKNSTHDVFPISECDSYVWHGTEYTASGTYEYDYTNAAGCPSTDTLKLTIKKSTEGIDTQVECDSYKWIDGITYTTSTTTPT
ncbi:MAG: hypothetical protein J6X98_00945, partial [Bacteroidales bacterium]|nr:hypothetical protein [Bacteroidales bacterium]